MSIAAANGPGNLAAVTLERLTGRPSQEILKDWVDYYMTINNKSQVTLEETYDIYADRGRWALDSLKWEGFKTYLAVVWENLNEISRLHRVVFPAADAVTIPMEEKLINSPPALCQLFPGDGWICDPARETARPDGSGPRLGLFLLCRHARILPLAVHPPLLPGPDRRHGASCDRAGLGRCFTGREGAGDAADPA
jgi:hypothetical protein